MGAAFGGCASFDKLGTRSSTCASGVTRCGFDVITSGSDAGDWLPSMSSLSGALDYRES